MGLSWTTTILGGKRWFGLVVALLAAPACAEAPDEQIAGEEIATFSSEISENTTGWHSWEAGFNNAPPNLRTTAMARGPIAGALEVFAVSTSGTLYHNFLSASGWHGWEINFNGAPGNVTSVALAQGPIAVGPSGGSLEVFLTTADGTLYHNFLNSSGWHGWEPSFNGAPLARSVALSQGPIGGALEVFAIGTNGTLHHNFLNSSGWHGWEAGFNGAPAGVTSVALAQGPIAVGPSGGALEVFATAGGVLYHNFLNSGGWHGWEASFNGAPTGVTSVALAQGPIAGALEVFAIAGGILHHNFLNSAGWHGWEASFNGAPAGVTSVAMSRGPVGGELEVFAVASGVLYRNFLDNLGWAGWTAGFNGAPSGVTSVALAQGPIAVGSFGGSLEVFLTANGTLFHNFLTPGPATLLRPDLVSGFASVVINPPTFPRLTPIPWTLRVCNQGGATAGAFTGTSAIVQVISSTQSVTIDSRNFTFPPLAAGACRGAQGPSLQLGPGHYAILAIFDSGAEVVESSESNNGYQFHFLIN